MNNKTKLISLIMEHSVYCDKYDEDITLQEFKVIKEEVRNVDFDSKIKTVLKYGLVGALGAAGGLLGGAGFTSSDSGIIGSMGVGAAVVGILLSMYRKNIDSCRIKCSSKKDDKLEYKDCYYSCYIDASNENIKLIKKGISDLPKIQDIKKKYKMEKKLRKQLKYYEDKLEKYKNKLNDIKRAKNK